MKGGKSPLGYTIIEVMIVLAASGLMLVIAGTFINGKQAKTSFTSGVNELVSNIQDTINQVTDGQYSDIPLDCQPQGAGIKVTLNTGGAQGTNSNCFFLGKIMHFQFDGQNNRYEVISMAGKRLTGGASPVPVSTLAEATPEPIEDLTITQTVPQNLDVMSVRFSRGGSIQADGNIPPGASIVSNTTGLAFIQTIVAGGEAAQGAQTPPKLHFVTGMHSQGHPASFNISRNINPTPADSAQLCVTDGTRSAFITVGINNSQQNAIVTMRGNVACP